MTQQSVRSLAQANCMKNFLHFRDIVSMGLHQIAVVKEKKKNATRRHKMRQIENQPRGLVSRRQRDKERN
jgi:hypothetical protein